MSRRFQKSERIKIHKNYLTAKDFSTDQTNTKRKSF